jgi:hypothetical protein
MRTTLNIDDRLLAIAKHRAMEQEVSLTLVIEDALHDAFSRAEEKSARIQLLTVKGAGVKPGIDLDRTSSLLDLMEEL